MGERRLTGLIISYTLYFLIIHERKQAYLKNHEECPAGASSYDQQSTDHVDSITGPFTSVMIIAPKTVARLPTTLAWLRVFRNLTFSPLQSED